MRAMIQGKTDCNPIDWHAAILASQGNVNRPDHGLNPE